jgi:Concanavalin A-like lectin/glucanases superfamily
MPRIVKLALVCALTAVASLALAAGVGAKAKLTADYRLEGNLKSKGVDAPNLEEVGTGSTFDEVEVRGKLNGVWTWAIDDGLRLEQATKVLGSKGKTYTIVMLVRLDDVADYNKIVDFDNRDADEGWYVYEGGLYPYDLHFDYEKQVIEDEKWAQIALTRTEKGIVHGYADGKQVDGAKDKNRDVALGDDKILHFLLDDGNPAESSGGDIARLRIWDTALSKKRIKRLGK